MLSNPKDLWQIFRRKRFNAFSSNSYKLQETYIGVTVNFKKRHRKHKNYVNSKKDYLRFPAVEKYNMFWYGHKYLQCAGDSV